MDIKLNDILHLTKDQVNITKIKFNNYYSEKDIVDKYVENPDIVNINYLFGRTYNANFKEGQIAISLLELNADTHLLTTIKKVTKDLKIKNGISFEGTELDEYKPFFGRIIINFHKTSQQQCLTANNCLDKLIVTNILPTPYDGKEFKGYDNVCLSYIELKNILEKNKIDWINAFKNQKAVYLITDKNNGKLYVGSAYGNEALLGRWKNYVDNGHGGNKILKKIVNEKGFDYIKKNFQYSILDIFNSKVSDKIIIDREQWWKDTLCTRNGLGYNDN
ncbi:MAG: GIY-YIG nuclease family protein [Alphaproteobacteria bacterium]